jgi:IclR family KDG regulon transcriptional repressor
MRKRHPSEPLPLSPAMPMVENAARSEDAERGERGERGGIQSIERAFAILEEIARQREGASLAEISRRLGLHSSTTFHLVQTMVALGYVRQMPESKRYRPGRALFALASACLDEIELARLAIPVLESLSAATGETAHFAIRSGKNILVIAKTPGSGAFQLAERVGVARPAHCTALGKVLLAALHPEAFERYLSRTELQRFTPKTITEPDLLRQEIARIRHDGIAFDDGEFEPELRCIAAPVQDFTAAVIGAIGISGPLWRFSLPVIARHTEAVRAAARRLSEDMGVPQPDADDRLRTAR